MSAETESVRERVARALFAWNTGKAPYFVITSEFGREVPIDDPYLPIAAAALAAVADAPGLEEALAQVLREHQPTTGMSVAMGVTCRCGYWNGNEVGGKTRPVGYQGLQWHQAEVLADVVRAWLRGIG